MMFLDLGLLIGKDTKWVKVVPGEKQCSYQQYKLLMTRKAYTVNRNVKTLLERLLASRGPVVDRPPARLEP